MQNTEEYRAWMDEAEEILRRNKKASHWTDLKKKDIKRLDHLVTCLRHFDEPIQKVFDWYDHLSRPSRSVSLGEPYDQR